MLTVDPMLPTSITPSTDSAFIPPPSTLKKSDSCFGDKDPCSRGEHRVVVLFYALTRDERQIIVVLACDADSAYILQEPAASHVALWLSSTPVVKPASLPL